jgi:uncharacterized protein (DUF1684 family)
MSSAGRPNATALLDWRRRVAALYAEIRAADDLAAAHETWQRARNELFANHSESPLPEQQRLGFAGLPVAPYDARLSFTLEVDDDVEPSRLEMATSTDGTVPFERAGVVHVPEVGDLDVWWMTTYGGGLFVPIKDGLAGRGTYGGGRYLLDTVKGADLGGSDGFLVIDLNFAYNPSCAYDPSWTCPLAPVGNTVAVEVVAGELYGPGPTDRAGPTSARSPLAASTRRPCK